MTEWYIEDKPRTSKGSRPFLTPGEPLDRVLPCLRVSEKLYHRIQAQRHGRKMSEVLREFIAEGLKMGARK